jgi:hypothetical protein
MNKQPKTVLLSQWWRTESCRRAFARAMQKRNERIAKVRAQFAARKAQLARDVETWETQ